MASAAAPPLVLGAVGLSLEDIEKGEKGQAVFNGREVEVSPLEDIPRYIDVVIVSLPNRVRVYERPVRNLRKAVGSDLQLLSTDVNGQFNGAIAQNAKEDADIPGLPVNEVELINVSIQAKEQLRFRLFFWTRKRKDELQLDEDSFLDFVDLDLANLGVQIAGANQYYLSQRLDPPLLYKDEDEAKQLHVSLQNLSAAAKSAGEDGQVKVTFTYSPLLEEV